MPVRIRMTETYRDWINALKDRSGRARIQVRVDRLAHGNPGKHRKLTVRSQRAQNRRRAWVSGLLHGEKGRTDYFAGGWGQIDAEERH